MIAGGGDGSDGSERAPLQWAFHARDGRPHSVRVRELPAVTAASWVHFQSRTSSAQTVYGSVWVTLCDLWRVGDGVGDGMWVRVC